LNIIDFGNGKELFSFTPKNKNNIESADLLNEEESDLKMLINVSISAAITGYSRIFMSYFKNNPLFKLYY
jgi:hypothetical protein